MTELSGPIGERLASALERVATALEAGRGEKRAVMLVELFFESRLPSETEIEPVRRALLDLIGDVGSSGEVLFCMPQVDLLTPDHPAFPVEEPYVKVSLWAVDHDTMSYERGRHEVEDRVRLMRRLVEQRWPPVLGELQLRLVRTALLERQEEWEWRPLSES